VRYRVQYFVFVGIGDEQVLHTVPCALLSQATFESFKNFMQGWRIDRSLKGFNSRGKALYVIPDALFRIPEVALASIGSLS